MKGYFHRGPVTGLQVDDVALGDRDIADPVGLPHQRFAADANQFSGQDGAVVEAQLARTNGAGCAQHNQRA